MCIMRLHSLHLEGEKCAYKGKRKERRKRTEENRGGRMNEWMWGPEKSRLDERRGGEDTNKERRSVSI